MIAVDHGVLNLSTAWRRRKEKEPGLEGAVGEPVFQKDIAVLVPDVIESNWLISSKAEKIDR